MDFFYIVFFDSMSILWLFFDTLISSLHLLYDQQRQF